MSILAAVSLVVIAVVIHLLPPGSGEQLSVAANLVSAAATLLAIAVAYYVYRREHDRHSAAMLLDAYSRFYDSREKRTIRAALEGGAHDSADRIILRDAVGKAVRSESLSQAEETFVQQLDEYLNFFQFIGWLLDHKDLDVNDVQGMFSYYVAELCSNHNAWLLPYLHKYGFSELEQLLRSASAWPQNDVALLFVYGTLRSRGAQDHEKSYLKGSRCVGRAQFWGKLYDLGEYPGLVESWNPQDLVHGELYEVTQSQLSALDEHEGCGLADGREYVRRACQVKGPGDAWRTAYVYIYNKDVNSHPHISCGDYVAHRALLAGK